MCGFLVIAGDCPPIEAAQDAFQKIARRGPDTSAWVERPGIWMGFHRLAVVDLSTNGMQPMQHPTSGNLLVCNGEIYNTNHLRTEVGAYPFRSASDCEVIHGLYERHGLAETCRRLDGEFAFVIWDAKHRRVVAGRDPLGIRPMFVGRDRHHRLHFASELKALHSLCVKVSPFPPGHLFDGVRFLPHSSITRPRQYRSDRLDQALPNIRGRLSTAVHKRTHSDAPRGYLLSGGLDSSLVCALAQQQSEQPIETFAVGMRADAIDLKYARTTASFIGSNHQELLLLPEQVIAAVEPVIVATETWDVTTIRASIGMYLLAQHIAGTTTIKTLMTGEVSDELFGYKYTDYAPSPEAFQAEAQKRVEQLYMYDALRADRCLAAHGLEARVPFSDPDFVEYVMSLNPELKMNTLGVGKFLLRTAFHNMDLLPKEILWRDKAAFSDAVGHSLVDILKAEAQRRIDPAQLTSAGKQFRHAPPYDLESLWYRQVFASHYPQREQVIDDFWMPNREWVRTSVHDPSARFLPNYGMSGS